MNSAMQAAQEVKADLLSVSDYQEAFYYYQKAQAAYRFKDFERARDYAIQATLLAEKSELSALKAGAVRTAIKEDNLFEEAEKKTKPLDADPKGKHAEYATPSDMEVPADGYDKKMQDASNKDKKTSGAPLPKEP